MLRSKVFGGRLGYPNSVQITSNVCKGLLLKIDLACLLVSVQVVGKSFVNGVFFFPLLEKVASGFL